MLSMSRDGTIDRSMETKSEEILSAGTTVPFPICPQQICVPFLLHLHPLNDRQLKDAWVTPDLERPRPFPNPADDPRLHAIHDRKPPLRLSIARSGIADAGATEPRGAAIYADSIFSIVTARGLSLRDRFQFLRGLLVYALLKRGRFFPPPSLPFF